MNELCDLSPLNGERLVPQPPRQAFPFDRAGMWRRGEGGSCPSRLSLPDPLASSDSSWWGFQAPPTQTHPHSLPDNTFHSLSADRPTHLPDPDAEAQKGPGVGPSPDTIPLGWARSGLAISSSRLRPKAGRSSQTSSNYPSQSVGGRPARETVALPSAPHPSPTLTAPGPEGPPASCLMASLLPAQTSLLPGQPHHSPASGAPPRPSHSWHMEPRVCVAPLFPPGRQLGRRQRKGPVLCCTSSRGDQRGTSHCLGLGVFCWKEG